MTVAKSRPSTPRNSTKYTGFYEFQQLDGKRTRINKDQVRTVKDL